jgi:hypothetical protein
MPSSPQGQNPILPATAFIPDGEPHVFEYQGKQRVFLYGSRDQRVTGFCGDGHDVWSAPVDDLARWTNHGEIFHVRQVQDIGYGVVPNQHFGAPDCVYNPVTKKYYFYTFLGEGYHLDGVQGPHRDLPQTVPGFEEWGPKCVRAESDSPTGPFVNPVICDWPALNSAGAFDPSVLVDEQADGSIRVFAYWGMMKGDRWAEVDPRDMHTIIDPKTRKPDRKAWHPTLNPDAPSSLFEASSIRKVASGHYVFIYSAWERPSALTYCYGTSPAGPWTYGGRIIDNGLQWSGGTGHGSIVPIEGRWYVFYHRKTNDDYNRQVLIEPIEVKFGDGKVEITPVEMTSQGIETNGLDAFRRYNANIVSCLSEDAYVNGKERNLDGLDPIVEIGTKRTEIGYKYLNFGPTKLTNADRLSLKLNIFVLQSVRITVQVVPPTERSDGSRTLPSSLPIDLASFDLQPSAAFEDITIPLTSLNENSQLEAIGGLQDKLAFFLIVEEKGSEACRLKEFEFNQGNTPTPNPLRDITIDPTKGGTVTSIPTRSRGGESIKLTVSAAPGHKLQRFGVVDVNGQLVPLEKNGDAPYALPSYHFWMPEGPVSVRAIFLETMEGPAPRLR